MSDAAHSRIVVFLVHGTWAGGAKWTHDDSALVQGLRKSLAPVQIEIRRLRWSGRNTHGQRLEAAEQLRADIDASLHDNHGIPHFIVAHSHGGNIACYALQDKRLSSAITGVLCLGTPFLHVHKSRLPKSLYFISLLTLLIFSIMAVLYLFRPAEDPITFWLTAITALLVFPVLGLLLLALWRARGDRFGLKSLLEARRNPDRYIGALALPELEPEKFVAVRITGDEAAGALVASQFFAWLFRLLWTKLAKIWEFFDRYRRAAGAIVGFVFLASFGAAGLGIISAEAQVGIRGVAVWVLALGGVVSLVIGFLAYCTLALMFVMHLPFGADAMLVSFIVQTTAEPSPPGPVNVYHVMPRDDPTKETAGLRHSEIYEHSRVIEFVGDWIAGKLQAA